MYSESLSEYWTLWILLNSVTESTDKPQYEWFFRFTVYFQGNLFWCWILMMKVWSFCDITALPSMFRLCKMHVIAVLYADIYKDFDYIIEFIVVVDIVQIEKWCESSPNWIWNLTKYWHALIYSQWYYLVTFTTSMSSARQCRHCNTHLICYRQDFTYQ